MKGFGVIYRNYGHWDIAQDGDRVFRIRGGPGKYTAIDERVGKGANSDYKTFKTLTACMSYICDELMYELIVADGQKPQIIESWNV